MTYDEMREALSNFAREEEVAIQLLGGLRRVLRARVWKVWAIHRTIGMEKNYTLTHIPTWLWVAEHYLECTLAVLAVRLDALGDWNIANREKLPLELLRNGRKVLKQWKKEVSNKAK
jgi:hypothetical protein